MPSDRANDFDPAVAPRGGPAAGLASFSDRLVARGHALPEAMHKVVRVIEEHPELLTEGTITELASRAGVAASTVTRLSKMLGYASLSQLRTAVAREQATRGTQEGWAADVGPEISPDDAPQAVLEKLTFAHLRMIRATAVQLDIDRLSDLAARIAAADRVDIYAIGGSANAAQMFANRAFRLGLQMRVWSEVHAGLVSASFLGPRSVAIAVSGSGRTPEVVQLARAARARGALTVAMVGRPGSRLAATADLVIPTASADNPVGGDLTPRYAQGFALDLLFLLIARLDVEQANRLLAATGRSVERHRRELELAEPAAAEPPVE